MAKIFVVTHGDKFSGANPGMTAKGFIEVAALRPLLQLLTSAPITIVCGTGRRHLDVAKTLNLAPTRYTSAVGDADSMELINDIKAIILADGTVVNPALYSAVEDNTNRARMEIVGLPDGSVVCAGRPLMIMLGRPDGKSAAVYRITCEDGEIREIVELVATGVVDPVLTK